ncbi:hypothetical protein BGZ60DRAFT_468641 [Tricladium varicosporioides]|nr:hypothetical protein BGZ60DRAFT_468641 [Hymenoscyphus varicosporioides]
MDSASSAGSSNPPPTRAQRGAIATQACETCRSRKQKCDEQRPKCGLCQRMKLECRYREPQPTKKDKTLVEILDRLKSLEGKVDRIPLRAPIPTGFGPPQSSPSSQPSFQTETESLSSSSLLRPPYQPSTTTSSKSRPYRHATAAHKMLTWPAIQQLLLQAVPSNISDLKSLELHGSAFVVRMQKGSPNLPLDENLQAIPFVGMQSQATRTSGGARTTFPTLTKDVMHRLATAYFDTFNLVYPFMDRQNFLSDTLSQVQTEGFSGDTDSVLALLVFALGELAIEGSRGHPIESHEGHASGVRGGTAIKPPGLALFNEARKRIGFVLTECDLENVQIFSLAANTIDWDSPKGDLIKRAYWHCVNMETSLHLELDLPLTGILTLEGEVGMPNFNNTFSEADQRANQASHFEAHYASQLALRRVCNDIHNNIYEFTTGSDTPSSDISAGPTASSLKQLASRLTQWRGMLPRELQWSEEDSAGHPAPQQATGSSFGQALDPQLSPQQPHTGRPLFSLDLNSEPIHYPYLYDLQVALLRTKYYYARYMIHRPFIYKALHFPEQMTQEDAEGAAECLRSCLKWPLTLSPTSRRKRLVPYLFCWSQNFLGILLILHITRYNPMLRDIRTQLCGARFEAEVEESIELMLDWIRDLKSSDRIAMWCWKILQGIYNLAEQG